MSCTCTKNEIEAKVITALRISFKKSNITPASRFGKEIDIDDNVKRGLFFVVKLAVDDTNSDGCELQKLTPDDFAKFRKVNDIIVAVSNEFNCKNE